jgi:hypothetical protein
LELEAIVLTHLFFFLGLVSNIRFYSTDKEAKINVEARLTRTTGRLRKDKGKEKVIVLTEMMKMMTTMMIIMVLIIVKKANFIACTICQISRALPLLPQFKTESLD